MKFPWFRLYGIFYFPRTLAGWLIFVGAIIYAVYEFFNIDSKSHSVSDTLRPFIISVIFIWIVYSAIAHLTSRNRGKE
jgi:hypothetical protein